MTELKIINWLVVLIAIEFDQCSRVVTISAGELINGNFGIEVGDKVECIYQNVSSDIYRSCGRSYKAIPYGVGTTCEAASGRFTYLG
ncbi:MAG: hypothetical protein R3C61_14840 [Bacteroidia bacterium]